MKKTDEEIESRLTAWCWLGELESTVWQVRHDLISGADAKAVLKKAGLAELRASQLRRALEDYGED